MSGFTGLYFEYYYYRKWIFVFRYRRGAYDYWNGSEERCGVKSETNLECICMSTKIADFIIENLKNN